MGTDTGEQSNHKRFLNDRVCDVWHFSVISLYVVFAFVFPQKHQTSTMVNK